jgi:hypothetical protein
VVYTGNKPRHFSSHYQEEPPPEALPMTQEPPKETGTLEATTDEGGDAKAEGAPATPASGDKAEPGKAPESADKPADSAEADKPAKAEEKAKDSP